MEMSPQAREQEHAAAEPATGLLLMAYGSPERLEDLGEYLLDIRGGRPTSAELVAEMRHRYALLGGRSPLLERTLAQAAALEGEMNRRFRPSGRLFRAYVGMRHWQPRIKEAVERMVADGIRESVALVMAPHQSRLSTGAYYARLEEALEELGGGPRCIRPASWHNHPGLIGTIAEKAASAIARFGEAPPFVLFTAHSLPERILQDGDPYSEQLGETARLLAEKLDLEQGSWRFSYQSAGQSAEPWLGPQIEQVIPELAAAGVKNVLVVPVGFVCDHVEVLYDIDIAARQQAQDLGMRLERSASLNHSPTFITALADIVCTSIA